MMNCYDFDYWQGQKMIDASDILIDIYMIDSIQMVIGGWVWCLAGGCGWWGGSGSYTVDVHVAATIAMRICGFLFARLWVESCQ